MRGCASVEAPLKAACDHRTHTSRSTEREHSNGGRGVASYDMIDRKQHRDTTDNNSLPGPSATLPASRSFPTGCR